MPRCIVDNAESESTVYTVIGGRRVDMCLRHWACWQRLNEGVYPGLARWLAWNTPTWRHGEAQYQIAWEGGQVVGRRLSDNAVIAQSGSATDVLNALMAETAGLIRVEPVYNNPPYPITGIVRVKPGRQIRGYGRQSVFRIADGASFIYDGVYYGAFFFGQDPQTDRDCVVSDVSVDGNAEAAVEGSYVFHGRGASSVTIADVEVYNAARFAIYTTANACTEWKLERSHIWGCQDDAWFAAAAVVGSRVQDCVFAYNEKSHGIRGHPSLFDGGDIRTWGAVAPDIKRCVSRFCGQGAPQGRYNIAGFHLRGNTGALVEDCVVENAGSQGALFMACRGLVVRRLSVRGTELYTGLYLEGCLDSLVERASVRNIANDVGVVVGSWPDVPEPYKSHGTVVRECRVAKTGGPGFFTDSSRVTFVDCEAEDCGKSEAWQEYERAGFVVCGSQDVGSKVLRSKARGCRYGFSDRGSGAGISNKATVADCDFTGCEEGYYFGNPDHEHVLVRNKVP